MSRLHVIYELGGRADRGDRAGPGCVIRGRGRESVRRVSAPADPGPDPVGLASQGATPAGMRPPIPQDLRPWPRRHRPDRPVPPGAEVRRTWEPPEYSSYLTVSGCEIIRQVKLNSVCCQLVFIEEEFPSNPDLTFACHFLPQAIKLSIYETFLSSRYTRS